MLGDPGFTWHAATNGYEMLRLTPVICGEPVKSDEKIGQGLYIVPRSDGGAAGDRTVHPLQHSDLYLRFAAIAGAVAACSFANDHGLLGPPIQSRARRGTRRFNCESVALWRLEVAQLRWAIDTWNEIQTKELEWSDVARITLSTLPSSVKQRLLEEEPSVDRLLEWLEPDCHHALPHHVERELEADADVFAHHLRDLYGVDGLGSSATPRETARHMLERTVSEYLARLMPPVMRWNQSGERLELSIAPETLLGAIWAQFATTLASGAKYRQCVVCERMFEVSLRPSSGARSDRTYCSDNCRAKAYRDRNRETLRRRRRSARRAQRT